MQRHENIIFKIPLSANHVKKTFRVEAASKQHICGTLSGPSRLNVMVVGFLLLLINCKSHKKAKYIKNQYAVHVKNGFMVRHI